LDARMQHHALALAHQLGRDDRGRSLGGERLAARIEPERRPLARLALVAREGRAAIAVAAVADRRGDRRPLGGEPLIERDLARRPWTAREPSTMEAHRVLAPYVAQVPGLVAVAGARIDAALVAALAPTAVA